MSEGFLVEPSPEVPTAAVTEAVGEQKANVVASEPAESVEQAQAKVIAKQAKVIQQYRNDLRMWQTAHGADYPARRLAELDGELR